MLLRDNNIDNLPLPYKIWPQNNFLFYGMNTLYKDMYIKFYSGFFPSFNIGENLAEWSLNGHIKLFFKKDKKRNLKWISIIFMKHFIF